jgi:hypothetical protein
LTDLDLIHFEQLKTVVQAQYLKEHTPSFDEISKWKGIDIIYFQEDLRKRAKGNISEKSFYTYFKSSPVSKLPRIDMLNLLSIYAGFESWYDFKKQHLFAGELLIDNPENETELISEKEFSNSDDEFKVSQQSNTQNSIKKDVLQEIKTENQDVNNIATISENQLVNEIKTSSKSSQKWIWIAVSSIIVSLLAFIGFKDEIFQKHYTYCFTDADRNLKVQSTIEIKVFKENESPLFYRINPGECFIYETKDKILKMQISSTVYENLEINRSLENAPEEETIELKPDDYKMALLYFSTKDVSGNPSEQISLKRKQLENLISNDAVIYQVYDNEIYGVETLDKQKYITLVTTPTTSLKNLSYIEMKKDKKGKIVSIKFKISNNENTK